MLRGIKNGWDKQLIEESKVWLWTIFFKQIFYSNIEKKHYLLEFQDSIQL